MSKSPILVAGLSLILIAVSGCEYFGRKESAEPDAGAATVEDRSLTQPGTAESYPTEDTGGFRGNALDDPESPLQVRVIYFDYDASEVRREYQAAVEAHARFLANNPTTAITLEGHADERGSREYNLALGERRANAVRRYVVLLGASAEQLRSVSYGEERPVSEAHDDAAWALNRRVEIIY